MAEFVKVLESVISIRDIRKVATEYEGSMNGRNKRIHYLWVEYYDGTKYEYRTTDIEKAKRDYEGLKNALLGLKDGERRTDEQTKIPVVGVHKECDPLISGAETGI